MTPELEDLLSRLDARRVGIGCNIGIILTRTPDPDCAEAAAKLREQVDEIERLKALGSDRCFGTSSDARSTRPDAGDQ